MAENLKTITLGAGCFWCTEAVFVQVRGVLAVESGYSNGPGPAPSYRQICAGDTGYCEVVQLRYDPEQVATRALLEIFFLIHDPTSLNRQGADIGTQYRSGIYYSDTEQAQEARALMAEMAASGAYPAPLVTEVLALANYVAAEAYHQNYFERNPDQAYCQAVAAPKVEKFRKTFLHLQKA